MSGIHDLLHGSLAASGAFLTAVVFLTIAVSAAALIAVRSGRLSARSRHAVLSLATLAPVAGALFAATGVARALRGLLAAPALDPAGSVSSTLTYTVTPAQPRTDWICTLFALWAGIAVILAFRTVLHSLGWARVARRAKSVTDPELLAMFVGAADAVDRLPRLAASAEAAEPMVVGVLAPTVILPESYVVLPGRLSATEMRAVLTHELEHVRRRDNLTAALHELAAAVFWFDPLRWMARRRMLELRERACDERVLDLGCRSESYVSALAKSCHAAIESPAVACMSGFHVKERIESIMSYQSERLHFASDKLVRAAALAGAMILVVAFGAVVPPPTFAAGPSGAYSLNVGITPVQTGKVHLYVRVTTPAGKVLSADAIFIEAKPASIETSDGARTLKIDVPNAAAGQTATLEVIEGNAVIARASSVIQKMTKTELPLPPAGFSRVGGNVKAPVVISRVEPKYTEEARADRIQGIVILDVMINEQGVVRNVDVLKPLPNGLSEAAVEAVRQWRFQPATVEGKPVPVVFTITVNFRLDGDKPKE